MAHGQKWELGVESWQTDSAACLLPAFSSTGPEALCGQILLPEIPSGLRPSIDDR